MNGTTNFMLTKMESEGADYAGRCWPRRRRLGYAEVEFHGRRRGPRRAGEDRWWPSWPSRRGRARGGHPCKGISAIQSIDFQYAKQMGATIKLAGVADATGVGPAVGDVSPVVVLPRRTPLASARWPPTLWRSPPTTWGPPPTWGRAPGGTPRPTAW
ncbi:unnamed protein product [Heterosigma akashiwo]